MSGDQDSGFIRQRRNLMVVSLVLLFAQTSELTIHRLNIFGNELQIEKPEAINLALWIAALYWLLRFYQYSRPKFATAIRDKIYYRVQEIAPPTALEVALRRNAELRDRFPGVPVDPEVSITNYTFGNQTAHRLEMELELSKAAGTAVKAAVQGLGKHAVVLEGNDLRKLRFRAWIYLVLHTPNFTDLLLPYVLFALPVCYSAYYRIG